MNTTFGHLRQTRTSSSWNPGFHAEKSSAYFLFTMALAFSPSYEMANRFRTGKLTKEEKKQLPKDFDQVLATYDLVGDANNLNYGYWWLDRGIKIFGLPYSASRVKIIDTIPFGESVDLKSITNEIKTKLIEERKNEGQPPTLIVSIPLNLKKSEILKTLKKIVNDADPHKPELPAKPLIKIIGRRFHVEKIIQGFRLLGLQAAYPKRELWRLGAEIGISSTYSPVLDFNGPRKPKDAIEMNDRIILSKITNRTKKRFELIAENAARGRFLSDEEIDYAPFDYSKMGKRFLENAKSRRTAKELFAKRKNLQEQKNRT